ncbi:MAG: PAS domain S-box protein, partial [Bacillota bacterium]|nr:PAS domain S-box protein [Bacillota bacterium]
MLEAKRRRDGKRAEEALPESEKRLRAVVSSAPIVLFALDREGVFTLSEGKGLAALGLKPGEVVGRSVFDVYRDVPEIGEKVRRALAGEEFAATVEAAGLTFDCKYTPLRDQDGEVAGVIGVATDITEHKRAEAQLRESKQTLEDMARGISDGILLLSKDFKVLWANEAALKQSGCEIDQVIGSFCYKISHRRQSPCKPPSDPCPIYQVQETGEPVVLTHTHVDAQGKTALVEVSAYPIKDEKGETVKFVHVSRDVTERKQAEEALQESEAKYRQIFESVQDIFYRTNTQGIIIELSPSVERFGYTRERLIGTQVLDIYENPEQRSALMKAVLERGEVTDYELRLKTGDGRVTDASVSAHLFRGSDGTPVGFEGSIRDITERKRAEEALRESEARKQAILNAIPDLMFRISKDGTFLDYAAEKTGDLLVPPSEFLGKKVREVLPPKLARQCMHHAERALQTGDTQAFQYQLLLNGEMRDFEARIAATGEDEVLAIVRDITEQERAEELRRQAEQRYRGLFEEAPAIYVITRSQDGVPVIADCNEVFFTTLGYTRAEVLGRPLADFYTPESRAELLEGGGFQRALAGRFVAEERQLLTCDGRVVDTLLRAVPEFDPDGHVVGTRAMYVDIAERKQAEEALQESEERYRDLVENINEVIYAMDANGRITYVSPVVERLGGYKPSEVIGRHFTEFIHPDDLLPLVQSFQRTVSDKGEPFEYRVLTKSGEIHWVRTSSRFVFEGDRMVGLRAVLMDITERKQAEEALEESERRYRLLAENASDVIWTMDLSLRYTYVSPSIEHMRGYTPEEVVGSTVAQTLTPASLELARKTLAEELAIKKMEQKDLSRSRTLELEMNRKDGSTVWTEVKMTFLRDPDGQPVGILGVTRDITERKLAQETIRHLAYHDALTNLPNGVLFRDRLSLALAQARRNKKMLAVMFLDLDRFKLINDTLGHAAGDQLLQSVGEQLEGLVREGDAVARMGGDEFTVLLPGISQVQDAVSTAQRILETVKQPRVLAGHEFHITTSIGIAIYPSDGTDAEALMRNADTAMYRAKEQGRDNCQLYSPAMNANILERMALLHDLRHALEREEFVVYYQPQVNINTGQIVGAEALARWQHPERGLLYPEEFIPLAEDTGLIVPLGEWVLRTACVQNKAWQEAGFPAMRVTVNISARQFQQESMVETVSQVLKETGLAPQYLQLEITEDTLMQDADFTITMLRDLRRMGVEISIDDFGTGYSSLNYL